MRSALAVKAYEPIPQISVCLQSCNDLSQIQRVLWEITTWWAPLGKFLWRLQQLTVMVVLVFRCSYSEDCVSCFIFKFLLSYFPSHFAFGADCEHLCLVIPSLCHMCVLGWVHFSCVSFSCSFLSLKDLLFRLLVPSFVFPPVTFTGKFRMLFGMLPFSL